MSAGFTSIRIRNYRALADVSLPLGPITALFGPNGSGKSSILDTVWFVRDCAIRGVDVASSQRSHGIGLLFDGAGAEDNLEITLATVDAEYRLEFGLSSGRIESYPGERLTAVGWPTPLLQRPVGRANASVWSADQGKRIDVDLRDPTRLSLERYLDMGTPPAVALGMDHALRAVHRYNCRGFLLHRLGQFGSEVGHETWLYDRGENLFSVLRNLKDRSGRDDRYGMIDRLMRRAFPCFDGLEMEQTSPTTVYCSFIDTMRRDPIRASGVSDGHLQMLLLLTSLFAEPRDREPLLLLDEPETSLHPWALAVLAEAVRYATHDFGRQVLLATHSPVLISQFAPEESVVTELRDGRTALTRVSEIPEVAGLLADYAAGSLYMAEVLGPQSAGAGLGAPATSVI
ncbi:MAG: AAA family ATPase [Armatimonadetes bacterium]|nr:AAA family ATPase [Armatimonadota bacterium]